MSQKRSENSIFYGFQTQARSHEPIFGDRTPIFGVNVTHWWGIENQIFGGDPMTLPFLHFSKKQMDVTLTKLLLYWLQLIPGFRGSSWHGDPPGAKNKP